MSLTCRGCDNGRPLRLRVAVTSVRGGRLEAELGGTELGGGCLLGRTGVRLPERWGLPAAGCGLGMVRDRRRSMVYTPAGWRGGSFGRQSLLPCWVAPLFGKVHRGGKKDWRFGRGRGAR